ncbi:MAG: ATP-binding protein [Microscillaceae bacterium]|jgi:hypothetical protein|nr:ATP-binding protein [Microscillaceae bacterium]
MNNHLKNNEILPGLTKNFNYTQLVQYTGDLEVPFYYLALNQEFANVRTFYGSIDIEGVFESVVQKYQVPSTHIWKHLSSNNTQKPLFNGFLLQLQNDLLFSYSSQEGCIKFYFSDHVPENIIKELEELVYAAYLDENYAKGKVFLMYEMNGYLYLRDFELRTTEINIHTNYNDDFAAVHEVIYQRLNAPDDKGLLLLHGAPGTGKTHYLRHLAGVLNKKMIFIPPDYAMNIASPHFLPLMISNPNSILIIEDAEMILEDREEHGRNASVSSLLNMADGLLSDCLNIQIICTFNTNISKIDKALLRKGRLIANYEFKPLEPYKAQKLSDSLGFKRWIEEAMTLAEIYNQD